LSLVVGKNWSTNSNSRLRGADAYDTSLAIGRVYGYAT
jgi:hypothetical protein